MARRRRARENPSTGVWIALGLVGAVGAGVGIYYLTKPKAAATPAATTAPTVNPATGQPITADQQAQLNAALAQASAQLQAANGILLNQGAQQNAAAASGGSSSTSSGGPVSTGIPQVDQAANNAASQLGF